MALIERSMKNAIVDKHNENDAEELRSKKNILSWVHVEKGRLVLGQG